MQTMMCYFQRIHAVSLTRHRFRPVQFNAKIGIFKMITVSHNISEKVE